jgi:hypothetical protein
MTRYLERGVLASAAFDDMRAVTAANGSAAQH